MGDAVHIQPERPDQPEVLALLDGLDRYLASLYAPEDNHILDLNALLQPEVDFLVARDAGQVIACGASRQMSGSTEADRQPYAEIKRMVVDPARRGRGVGARLLTELEARLRLRGVALARLETGRDQHGAVALYKRQGYRPCATFNGYPDNGRSLFMEKVLA